MKQKIVRTDIQIRYHLYIINNLLSQYVNNTSKNIDFKKIEQQLDTINYELILLYDTKQHTSKTRIVATDYFIC